MRQPLGIEFEDRDLRIKRFNEKQKLDARKRYFNPFTFSFTIFFGILAVVVILILLVVFVFLQQVFSNVGDLYGG